MNVSVITPAYNAVETISDTLKSLVAQTFPNWEAVVVDDGSGDETTTVVADYAKRDPRIRIVSQPHRGVCAARNLGISLAYHDWLVFLDADDWLSPVHLERLTDLLVSDPSLDAACCDYMRVAPDGVMFDEGFRVRSGDLFAVFAHTCIWAIHACIVRRSLVEAVGGFDPLLRACEDWDLWQRVARTGARFGVVNQVLAFYRVRPLSASVDGLQMLKGGFRVLTQGHSSDPRVPNPHPAHVNGMPPEQLSDRKFYFLCWCAGLRLGCGEDARSLLEEMREEHAPGLDPSWVAEAIFKAALLPSCRTPVAWAELWPRAEQCLNEFLDALEVQSCTPGLARRTRRALERMILEQVLALRSLTIGATHGIRVEVTEPIPDIFLPASVERLHCVVEIEGECFGSLILPVCDGFVSSSVLTDAIAAEFAWPLLGQFFERTIYRELRVEHDQTGVSVRRGNVLLWSDIPDEGRNFSSEIHDKVGWTVFLQDLWGRPDWHGDQFYDPQTADMAVSLRYVDDGWLVVEVSDDLPDVEVSGPELNVSLMVGGVTLGVVTIPVGTSGILRAQELRAAVTTAGGFELCRVCVREGVIGRSVAELKSLRIRLAEAAAAQRSKAGPAPEAAVQLTLAVDGVLHGMPALTPNAAFALRWAFPPNEHRLVFGQRSRQKMGTSASRRAHLPQAAWRELADVALVANEPALWIPQPSERPDRVVYAPDLVWHSLGYRQASAADRGESRVVESGDLQVDVRKYFETLLANPPDPWGYTNLYEQTKYEQTLALLPPARISRALELACAEGHFTVQLAPRVGSLIAADISHTALGRAAERCTGLTNVSFMRLDLTQDPLPGQFDLIICSEVLYYVGGYEELRAVAHRLAEAIEPGGYLLMAHANLVVDEPDQPGFDWGHPFGAKAIGEVFANAPPLQLVKELRTVLYRIQLFRREGRAWFSARRRKPEIIEGKLPTPLPSRIDTMALWQGKSSPRITHPSPTAKLPILMYHRVAPEGASATHPYRVTPEAFAEQLQYLSDHGFYSVQLEDWRRAMEGRRALPGRAILITFDDGHRDFLTHAWPLLRRYGFSATVCLVADAIGGVNSWDPVYGEEVALLDWQEIRRLQDQGVDFGSHSASRRPLTALSPAEVVREGARSRTILEQGLGRSIGSFAYPYGDVDQAVQHLIGACGYTFGLSCRSERSKFQDPLLALPRIEVAGMDSLREFAARLNL